MPAGIRIAGAYVTFDAQVTGYTTGVNRAIEANRRLGRSYTQINRDIGRNALFISQFGASLRSSLVATVAYAAGVGAVSAGLRGAIGGFIEYDRALIAISKTTDIVGEDLARLGERLVNIITEPVGENRALGILREDLFSIAVAAGQAGIQTSEGIERIARASAALQISSDLIGTDAVRALTRYLQVTGQSTEQVDRIASAYTHLGNNIVGTESEISRFSVRIAQNLSSVGQASDELILGLSSTLLEAGVEMEAAGSALQRTQAALQRLAPDPAQFAVLRDAIGGADEEFEALRQRFVQGEASAEDYDEALLALLRTFQATPAGDRTSFVAQVVGGGEANVRNIRTIGILSNRYERLQRNIRLAGEALENENQHYVEAGRASESLSSRLTVVGNRLQEQGTTIGASVGPALVSLAEQYEIIEAVALAAATAIATGFGRRRVASLVAGQRSLAQESARARDSLVRQNAEVERLTEQQRISRASRGFYTRSLRDERALRASLTTQIEAQAAAEVRSANATATAVAASDRRIRSQTLRAAQTAQTPTRQVIATDRFQRDVARDAELAGRAQQRAATQLIAANREVGRTERRLQEIQRRRAAVGIRDSEQFAAAKRQEIRTQNQLSRAIQRQAELQAIANRQNGIAARIGRGLTGVYNFLGGGLGLLTTAITLGATAWLLWGNRVDEAAEKTRGLVDELNNATEALGQQGQTAAGTLLINTESQIETLRQQLAAAEARLSEAEAQAQIPEFSEIGLGPDVSIRSLEGDVDELREQYDALVEARNRYANAIGAQAEDTAIAVTLSQFEALPASILASEQAIEQFNTRLRDQVRQRRSQAVLEERLQGADQLTRDIALASFQAQQEAQNNLIRLLRERQAIQERVRESVERVAAAEAERDSLAVGSDAREQADRQLTNEERILASLEAQNTQLQAQVRLAREVEIDREGLANAIRLERQNEITSRLSETPEVTPDTARAARDVQRALEALREAQTQRVREAERATSILIGLNDAEIAGFRARVEVEDEFTRLQSQLRNQLVDVTEQLAMAYVRLSMAEETVADAGVRVSDAQLDTLTAARQSVATLQAEYAEREAAIDVLNRHRQEILLLAEATEESVRREAERQAALRRTAALREQLLAREVEIEDRLRREQTADPDLGGARRELEEGIRRIREAEEERARRAAADSRLIVGLTEAEIAAERARQAVLGRFADLEREIRSDLVTINDQLVDAVEELAEAEADVANAATRATDAQLDALDAARNTLVALQEEQAERTEQLALIDEQREALALLAEVAAEGAQRQEEQDRRRRRAAEEAIAALEREIEVEDRLRSQPIVEADTFGARQGTGQSIADIQRGEEARRRQLELGQQIARASEAEAAAIEARARVQTQVAQLEDRLRNDVLVTSERLTEETRRLAEAEAEVARAGGLASDAQLDALESSRQVVAALRAELEERRASVSVFEDQEAALEALAEESAAAARDAANLEIVLRTGEEAARAAADAFREMEQAAANRPLARLAAEAADLSLRLEEVAANGFNRLGDALTDLVTRGRLDFASLANAIIADLVRVLIQAQIILPIVQSLSGLGLFSGVFGGLFGGAAGGAPSPGLPGFHSGGAAGGAPPQNLNRQRGLRSDELFAVLQRGEIVIPRNMARRLRGGDWRDINDFRAWVSKLPRYHSGGIAGTSSPGNFSGGGGINVTINNQGTPQQVSDVNAEVRGRDVLVTMVTADARVGGPMTRALASGIRNMPRR